MNSIFKLFILDIWSQATCGNVCEPQVGNYLDFNILLLLEIIFETINL